jgi:maleamate amidohydrolase
VVVPKECVFDRGITSHAINLFDMQQKYADVVSVEELIRELN